MQTSFEMSMLSQVMYITPRTLKHLRTSNISALVAVVTSCHKSGSTMRVSTFAKSPVAIKMESTLNKRLAFMSNTPQSDKEEDIRNDPPSHPPSPLQHQQHAGPVAASLP